MAVYIIEKFSIIWTNYHFSEQGYLTTKDILNVWYEKPL